MALAGLGDAAQARHEIDLALRLDPKSLSARYAEAMLNGQTADPQAFQRLARRVLSRVPLDPKQPGRTIADVVFKDR